MSSQLCPLLYSFAEYPWQLFVTLTFRKARSPGKLRKSMFNAVARNQCRIWGMHVDALDWFLRPELGEVGLRFHYHALFAGFPLQALTQRNRLAIASQWEKLGGGMARVRAWAGSYEMASYVLTGVASGVTAECQARKDGYELSKFGNSLTPTWSKRLLARMASHSEMLQHRGDLRRKTDEVATNGECHTQCKIPESPNVCVSLARGFEIVRRAGVYS